MKIQTLGISNLSLMNKIHIAIILSATQQNKQVEEKKQGLIN